MAHWNKYSGVNIVKKEKEWWERGWERGASSEILESWTEEAAEFAAKTWPKDVFVI